MNKWIIVFILISCSVCTYAQRSEVVRELSLYKVDTNILNNRFKQDIAPLAFDLKQVTLNSSTEKVELASFDGKQSEENKWILHTVNGIKPSAKQLKSFLKAHPSAQPTTPIDQASFKIRSNQDSILVIGFKYLVNALNPENSFMKDCEGQLFINTKSRRLEKQVIQNAVPLRVKGIKIAKLLTVTTYNFDKEIGVYVPIKESTNMVFQLLGLTTDTQITSEYSNFKKH